MTNSTSNELLKKREVLDEIGRHQWIESEKAGRDIGFDAAAQDWLSRFSKAWMDYHLPQQNSLTAKTKTTVSRTATKRKSSQSAKAKKS